MTYSASCSLRRTVASKCVFAIYHTLQRTRAHCGGEKAVRVTLTPTPTLTPAPTPTPTPKLNAYPNQATLTLTIFLKIVPLLLFHVAHVHSQPPHVQPSRGPEEDVSDLLGLFLVTAHRRIQVCFCDLSYPCPLCSEVERQAAELKRYSLALSCLVAQNTLPSNEFCECVSAICQRRCWRPVDSSARQLS